MTDVYTTSPNMGLVIPTVGGSPGPLYAQDVDTSLTIIDQHNHSPGSGVQITPSGLNINANLSMQNFSLTNVGSVVLYPQASDSTTYSLYSINNDLYFTDGAGNVVQITSGGVVNATSSGIASGTASASFSSGVLVVDANTTGPVPANIQAGSILLGNNTSGSKYLTLSPPNAMGSNFTLTLPSVPAAQNFMAIDSSGNITAYAPVSAGITGANIASGTIQSNNIATQTILGGTTGNIALATVSPLNLVASINLVSTSNTCAVNSHYMVLSNTNASKSLAIVRGVVAANGSITSGEGFSINHSATGTYAISFTSSFGDTPAVVANGVVPNSITTYGTAIYSPSSSGFTVYTNAGSGLADVPFAFTAIGRIA